MCFALYIYVKLLIRKVIPSLTIEKENASGLLDGTYLDGLLYLLDVRNWSLPLYFSNIICLASLSWVLKVNWSHFCPAAWLLRFCFILIDLFSTTPYFSFGFWYLEHLWVAMRAALLRPGLVRTLKPDEWEFPAPESNRLCEWCRSLRSNFLLQQRKCRWSS